MKREEYFRSQVESSTWTRQSHTAKSLVEDSVDEFCKFTLANSTTLELGCGDGYSLDVLRKKGFRNLVGCDINLSKLEVAASRQHAVAVMDIHSIGFPSDSFDAVYCTHTLEHSHDGYRVMREIFRILKPGGLVFVIVPDHTRLYGDTYVTPDKVVPIEKRSIDYFDDVHFERTGIRPEQPRNQFPFTMKLLLATLLSAGFEIQQSTRIQRSGPELWAIGTKPEDSKQGVSPLISRDWNKLNIFNKIWFRIGQVRRK